MESKCGNCRIWIKKWRKNGLFCMFMIERYTEKHLFFRVNSLWHE